jgi:DNA invertase Pin-like site-specific DNA recombinase
MNGMTAIYMRVSTDDQRLDSQQRELKLYCQHRGWTNLHFYADKLSGAKASRPALDQMLADLRAGRLERLVVYKLDRLGRSLIHLALILDELYWARVPLVCTSQGIDTSDDNPAGKLQLGVLMAVAELERGIIRERVKAGVAAAKARGVKLGRPPKLKARAPEVMRLKGQGLGIRAISRTLGMPVSSVHSLVEWAERGWASVRQSSKQEAHV